MTLAFVPVVAFLTATLSGIFGMAGGLVLMGTLTLIMPVAASFVVHGLLQLVSNGWRAILHRQHIVWPILGFYFAASVVAAATAISVAWLPSRSLLFLLLGLVAMLVWLPKDKFRLDATRPLHALTSGFLVTLTNLTAGVAGPLLDVFFVHTKLNRHEIVATKAATQVFSHLAKIIVYGGFLTGFNQQGMPNWRLVALAIPASMFGTSLGGKVLDRINDHDFKRWTAWIVTAIGAVYLARSSWEAM